MISVLIIEDDTSTRLVTKLHLQNEYQILEAANGLEALKILEQQHVDLIVADVMMPHMDGYEFVRQLRTVDKATPVLLLTAKKEWQDKKNGFALGIDDYMTKPVHYEELLWRVRALLRRAQINNEKKIVIGNVVMNEESNMVIRGEERISLPQKEFELLFKLLSYPNKVFTTSQLLDDIWGYETDSDETTVRTHVNRLRKRFAGYQEFEIVTVRGLGYKGEIKK
ncbi:MAG: response regulator transcription factor [Clostridiales bacterium]|nr:response regulator transcription factor [Roseburia sp.]MDD7636807.1 response regulator transcription factor [Clostridiales bacterium]MDY4113101.1 response regulator transcription factor [Roseburia sp.]